MAINLPRSLRKDLHSISEEVAWARTLTPEQRLAVVELLCRDSVTLLNMNPHRERILERKDPLPASTLVALKRLRAGR